MSDFYNQFVNSLDDLSVEDVAPIIRSMEPRTTDKGIFVKIARKHSQNPMQQYFIIQDYLPDNGKSFYVA